MAKFLRDAYWRCRRCGGINRVRVPLDELEPTTYACEHCGEDSLVEAHDLASTPGEFRIPKRHTGEEDDPS